MFGPSNTKSSPTNLSAQLRIRERKKLSAQAVLSHLLRPDGQLLDQHRITIPYWSINKHIH